jgi:hypothetical protein
LQPRNHQNYANGSKQLRPSKNNQKHIPMIDYNSDPLFWQRFLENAGFYRGQLDGDFGEQSHAAAHWDPLNSWKSSLRLNSIFREASENLSIIYGQ